MSVQGNCIRYILETGLVIQFEMSAEKLVNRHRDDILEVNFVDPITHKEESLQFVATTYIAYTGGITKIQGNICDYLQIFIRIDKDSKVARVRIDLRSPPCKI